MTLFKQFYQDRAAARPSAGSMEPGDPEALLPRSEQRLKRARAVMAETRDQSTARIRRACRTILVLLPDNEEHREERLEAAEMLDLVKRGAA